MFKFRWEAKFKQTDIGKVSINWETKKLGDVITLQRGKDLPQSKRVKGKYPVIGSTGVVGYHNKYVANGPGVLVGRSGSTGSLTYIKEPYWPLNTTLWVKNFNGNYPLFIYYFFHVVDFSLYSGGVSVPTLNRNILHPLKIGIPSISEQKRIALVLSYFDKLVENMKRQNEILEKTAMAIFKSWFIDFEPFKDSGFVDSELGKIPKEWETKPLGKLFNFVKGRKCRLAEEYSEGYTPYLLIETYKTGSITHWTNENQPIVDEFDIIVVADGESSGRIFRFQKGILGSTLLCLKQLPTVNDLRHLVYLYLKTIEEELIEHRTGSAIPHLDKDYLKTLKIFIPPSAILERFNSIVRPLFRKIILNHKQIRILRKVRDMLLPLLVFGRLRVEEI